MRIHLLVSTRRFWFGSKSVLILSLLIISFLNLGCSANLATRPNEGGDIVLNNQLDNLEGSIVISRPIPQAQDINKAMFKHTKLWGFLPSVANLNGRWLLVDTKGQLLKLMEGDKIVAATSWLNSGNLEPGLYQILHKQKSPLWYAPDSYFEKRKLSLLGPGDKNRFRRGAFGEFVLFITKDTAIHSSPIWLDDVGGIQLDEAELSKIYYQLDVGAAVQITN